MAAGALAAVLALAFTLPELATAGPAAGVVLSARADAGLPAVAEHDGLDSVAASLSLIHI